MVSKFALIGMALLTIPMVLSEFNPDSSAAQEANRTGVQFIGGVVLLSSGICAAIKYTEES